MATAQQASNEALNVTYQIKKPELVSDISIYEVALNQADLNSCRLLNKNFEMKFENGLIVEVFSAQHLLSINKLNLDISLFLEDFPSERYESLFNLTENNQLTELRKVSMNKKTPR
jgi:hypothetical protein